MVNHINTNGTLPAAPTGQLPEVCLTALRGAYDTGAATPSSIIEALYPALSQDKALFITLAPLADLLARCRCAWRSHLAPSTSWPQAQALPQGHGRFQRVFLPEQDAWCCAQPAIGISKVPGRR